MTMIRIAVAAGAMLALAGCVTDDRYYGDSYYGDPGGSYRTGYYDDDYRTGTGGGYDRDRRYGYASDSDRYRDRGYDYAYDDRGRIVECDLPGENVRTTREDCRSLQRRYGRTIAEAEEMRRDRYRYSR